MLVVCQLVESSVSPQDNRPVSPRISTVNGLKLKSPPPPCSDEILHS